MKHTIWQIVYLIDLAVNVLFLGWAGEYISSRCYRQKDKKVLGMPLFLWGKYIINGIFFWQKDHCFESFLGQKAQAHMPSEYHNG